MRLGVRVQLAGHLGGPPPPLRGLLVPAGQLQVARPRSRPGWWPDRARAGGRGRPPRVRAAAGDGPGWPIRTPSGAAPRTGSRRTAPAARRRRGDLGEQGSGQRVVDRLDDLVLAPSAHRAQQVGVVVAAEHRGGGQHLPGRLAHRLQPGPQQVPDAGRRPPGAGLARRPASGSSAARRASTYSRTSMGSPRVSASSRDTSILGMPSRPSSVPMASGPNGPGSTVCPSDWLSASESAVRSTRSRPACSGCQLSTSSSGQSREPAHQVGEQAEGGAVGPVHVLDHHDPGRLVTAAGCRLQRVRDGRVQPGDRDRAVQRRRGRIGMRRGQRRDQPTGHRGGLRGQRVGQVGPDRQRGPQQVGGQHEREPGLAVMASGRPARRHLPRPLRRAARR